MGQAKSALALWLPFLALSEALCLCPLPDPRLKARASPPAPLQGPALACLPPLPATSHLPKPRVYSCSSSASTLQIGHSWSSYHGSVETNLTRIHKDTGLIPGLAQWVKDLVLP